MRMKNRYYVQCLTEQIFLVREPLSADGTPGADDRIVRSFQILHDAFVYASSMNEAQSACQSVVVLEGDKLSERPLRTTPQQTQS